MQLDTLCWRRAWSNPPPGCLWRLGRSASTLTQPVRPDGNVFCWWWRGYRGLVTSRCGCVSGCVQLIDREKVELECRCVETFDFLLLSNVNESMVAYCNFVIIYELNDYWLPKVLYSVQSGMVIAHMVRCSWIDDPCSRSGGCSECGSIVA